MRAREFLPQLAAPRDPDHVAVGSGVLLIGMGLVKKVVIADFLARTLVDPVFAVPQAYSAPDVLLAAYGYAAQIYCDFSGYTDMAIGLALLMGYVFPQNFRSPYRATGFRDFWRRWHMTLSRFLRDFLYIPLGGNRKGRVRTYVNLMATMVLGGLWHGAAWTFVVWGAFNGTMLCIEHAIAGRFKTPAWLRWFVTFNLIVLGWVLFRSQSIALVGDVPVAPRPLGPGDAVEAGRGDRDRRRHRPAARARGRACRLAELVRAPAPGRARRRAGDLHRRGRRYGAQPGRAPVHLLPLLDVDATPANPTRRQPDGAASTRAACGATARATRCSSCSRSRSCWRCSTARRCARRATR